MRQQARRVPAAPLTFGAQTVPEPGESASQVSQRSQVRQYVPCVEWAASLLN